MTIVNLKRITGILLSAFLITALTGLTGYAQTTYTVTNTDDSGSGSLRQAIIDAESSSGADIINATGISGTITLDSALSTITQDLTINGPGAANLSISGANLYRPFFVTGGTVQIKNLSIINGKAQGGSPTVGGGGGAGMGGAIYIDGGTVTLTSVTFSGNSAVGGNSYYADNFGYGVAGGDGPFANSGGAGGFSTSSYQGGNGSPGSFGGGGGSGGYGRYAGGFGGNGGYGGGAGAVGSKNDATSGGWSTVNPGTPGEFGGSSTSADFHGDDLNRRSGGGGAGLGGALFARSGSTVSLVSCTFTGNSASGGTAGTGGTAGKGKGGALFVHPGAVVTSEFVSFNSNTAADDLNETTDNDNFYGGLVSLAPIVLTADATSTSFSGSTLNGSVNPNGYIVTYWFQYGTSASLASFTSTSAAALSAGTSPVSVSATLTGLTDETTYYFRVVSTGEKGLSYGEILSFTTTRTPRPFVSLMDATGFSGGAATLNGKVNPNGSNTSYEFQYATSPSFTSATSVGAGSVAGNFSGSGAGNALDANNYKKVSIPDNGKIDFTDSFTMEAWVYQNPITYEWQQRGIVSQANNVVIFGLTSNSIYFYSFYPGIGVNFLYSEAGSIPVGEWVHVAATYDLPNNSIKLYKNGVLIKSSTETVYAIKPSDAPVDLAFADGSYFFNGKLDEIRIWTDARTHEEISSSYQAELSGNEDGLIGYYQFNETAGGAIKDKSSGGNNGGTIGSPTFSASGASIVSSSKTVSASVSGLGAGPYYYRLVATNSLGTTTSDTGILEFNGPGQDLVLWVKADSGIVTELDPIESVYQVVSWKNLAPGGIDLVQSDETFQPLFIEDALNGKPVLRFDGVNDHLNISDINIPVGSTVIFVAKAPGSYQARRILSAQGSFLVGFKNLGVDQAGVNDLGGTFGSGTLSNQNEFVLVTVTEDGSTASGYFNGDFKNSVEISRMPYQGPIQVGADTYAEWSLSQSYGGDLAELMVFNRPLNATERVAIETKLKLKYGIGVKSVSATPSVPSGETGSYVLGGTGATVTFTTPSGTPGSLTATTSNNPNIVGSLPIGIAGLATEKYWSIQNTGLTGIEYSITLDLTGISGITNFNGIKVVKREDENATWVDVTGSPFFATVTHDEPFITISGLTSFSEFAVGSGEENTLPVELSAFTGQISGGKVVLNWSTTTETNNYGWEIQKSEDGSQKSEDRINAEWETIGFVAGKGTTTEAQSYSFSSPVAAGSLKFRLKQIDVDGKTTYSQIVSIEGKPTVLALNQNYPNPFNPSTTIGFALPASGKVSLVVYDLLGREVATLLNKQMESGFQSVVFDASSYAAGVYFYKLSFNGKTVTKKLTLLK